MTLTLADFSALCAIMTIPVGLIAAYLSVIRKGNIAFRDTISRDLQRMNDRVDRHAELLVIMDRDKADKADWVRGSIVLRNKMDECIGQLKYLAGKTEAKSGVAAQVAKVAEEMKARKAGDRV